MVMQVSGRMSGQVSGVVAAVMLLAAAPAFAIEDGTREADVRSANSSVTFAAAGLSQAKLDFDNVKSAVNLNATIGFRIPTIDIFSVELDISQTVIPGSISAIPQCTGSGIGGGIPRNCPGKFINSDKDFQMSGIGVFGAVRSPGRFYGMAKYGYRYVQTSYAELDDQKTGGAWAVGGGYRWGRSLAGAELAYTHYSSDITFLGFNISYGFGGKD